MSDIIREKVHQASLILSELDIDLWLTLVRETTAARDPALELIYPHDLTWQSAMMIVPSGQHIAIVGHFEAEAARQTGLYPAVIPYHQSIREPLLEALTQLQPRRIAVNFSRNDSHADGLSYGMYQLLLDYLSGTQFAERLISAEGILRALRGRKTETEIHRIRAAIQKTEDIYQRTFEMLKPGMSEIEVAAFMHRQLTEEGLETAWEASHCPAVNAGPDSPVGHSSPTDIRIAAGQLLHFDFGVKLDGYCADIQRVVYVLKPQEEQPPAEVQRGFSTIVEAIEAARLALKPGVTGIQVDAIARNLLIERGYPEYKYATGHHLGRTVHDGAGILGPAWERYGDTPNYPIEVGQVYTLEPGLMLPDYGYIGLEEDVLVTEQETVYLSTPQKELILIK
ncbi:MAG: M24 family metallopeptidase [Anaerolineales bacterium]